MFKSFSETPKKPSYRIAGCGVFPNYKLNNSSLHNKNIIYLISVGKDKFEDKWIERFINFIEEVKPKKLLVVLGDTLQRFNIELYEQVDEKKAFEIAEARGNDWLKKYAPYFSKLKVEYEFIHWEELKKDKDYSGYFRDVTNLGEMDEAFKQALLESSKEYINRSGSHLYQNQALATQQSNKFLKEECAVFRVLAKEVDTIGIFYPGSLISIFEYIFDYINKNDRLNNTFFYKELSPTKEKKRNKKPKSENLNLYREFPFFECRKLSIDENRDSNNYIPTNSINIQPI